jgi:transcriptional regulator GlxA family with amidase domain
MPGMQNAALATYNRIPMTDLTTRTATRESTVCKAQHYIQAHLCEEELSPDSVMHALELPRSTLYRLFKQEGGLGAYIRHLRLCHAANDLIRFPNVRVMEIGFGVGFKSASDFTRAFRRAYGMAPQAYRTSRAHAG